MEHFSYDPHSYDGKAEAFFYGQHKSALSIFRSPNTDNIKGVGLHKHPDCDDIDILIEGAMLFSNDGKRFHRVHAPAVVANLKGTPHCLINLDNSIVKMYGLRSPFRGGVKAYSGESQKTSKIYKLNNYQKGANDLFESEHTKAIFYKDVREIPFYKDGEDIILINLGDESIHIEGVELKKSDVLKNWKHKIKLKIENNELLVLKTKGLS